MTMKAVILAGGKGTRLAEETERIPKPMVSIGKAPILAHLMALIGSQKITEFLIAGGYKSPSIRTWLQSQAPHTLDLGWHWEVVETGEDTCTGGRVLRLSEAGYLRDGPFLLAYGDGLADINLNALYDHHFRMRNLHDVLVTLTACNPPSRFGRLHIRDGLCDIFTEKGQDPSGWVNCGFYLVQPEVRFLIPGDNAVWELDVLPVLAHQGRLAAYQHPGRFQMMDTWRDRQQLEDLVRTDPFWLRWVDLNDDRYKRFLG